ncbi:hypothetical protein E2C01_088886 [Portunus trituberculatus]|uniref:Uncharacterized protein n=1 Tax=Portunus trituberculatus TaxID=210409 RepID=A0A5B7JHP1_PORTR|nr:hypothetical protein [Portunus trituberculatus]
MQEQCKTEQHFPHCGASMCKETGMSYVRLLFFGDGVIRGDATGLSGEVIDNGRDVISVEGVSYCRAPRMNGAFRGGSQVYQ